MSEFPLPWPVAAPHVEAVTVTPADIDGMGHVNNVVYLGWLERVAWSHSKALGMSLARYQALGTGCVARRHEIDYLAPCFLGDRLLLGTWIAENDQRLTMWRGYRIIRESDRKPVLDAKTLWVCVDMVSGRPKRQPADFLAVYQPAAALSS